MAARIVSLLPSATEIVWAIGAGDRLVGRSHECDFPMEARSLPVCTTSKVNSQASSVEIDLQVKSLLSQALSLYDIDTEQLRRLQPDLILTQAQCEVCAVSLADVERTLCTWLDSKPRVISLSPVKLNDVFDDILRVGNAIDENIQAKKFVADSQRRVETIRRAVAGQPSPSVVCIEWLDPLMAAGNWVPELVEIAGGRNLFGEAGHHSPWMQWNEIITRNPDIILVMPCGFSLAQTRRELPALTSRPGWDDLRAVRNRRVFLADGNQFFNRPGPRLIESAEILAEIFHPQRCSFGHEGGGWERL